MKKSWVAMLALALASFSAAAQDAASTPVATKGKMLYAADGGRLGAVYRVSNDGSAQLIMDGKMVTVPASTLSVQEGKLTTSLSKREVKKMK